LRGTTRAGFFALACGIWVAATSAESDPAEDRIELEETLISGNQELPRVLYIVPWQDPKQTPSIRLDPSVLEREVFRPLYPPDYRLELDQYDRLKTSRPEE